MSEHTSGHGSHRHKTSMSKQVLRTVTFVLTPFLMLAILCGLSLLLLSKPYEKIRPYTNLIFNMNYTPPDESLRTINKYRDDDAPLITGDVKDDATEETHTMIYPYYGDYYATLNCEAAGMIDIPVYTGTATDVLELGAGWYNGSKYIGKVGNVVIAGHNHTFFRNLPNCKEGDIVTLETEYCKLTYQVTEIVYFKDNNEKYVRQFGDDRLTLYTCWNDGRLGMSRERLGVICQLTERVWKDVAAE